MATEAPDDEVPGPSGCSGKTAAEYLIDSRICSKISMCIAHKWRPLGRKMGFQEGELTTLEINNYPYGLQETVYKMLYEWKCRMSNGATVKVLAEHLKATRNANLAEEIMRMAEESMSNLQSYLRRPDKPWRSSLDAREFQGPIYPAPPMSQVDLDGTWTTLKSALQMEHKRRQIPKIPWLKEWEMDFEKYYVDLTINHKTDTEFPKLNLHEGLCTESTLDLHNVFNPTEAVNPPNRILIEGPAGYGKSTLACKLCYDHAKGENYIRHFDAVILLRLRAFEGTVEEMITDTIQLKDYTAKQVLETIKQNQRKILIILDGFDELHKDKQHLMIPLLLGKQLTHATVVVTSRFGNIELGNEKEDSSVLKLLHCMDTRILIKGITGENRNRFLQLFFRGYSLEKVASLISSVENSFPFLMANNKNLFDCPLFLVLLVVVNEEEGIDSIKTKTELYKKLFNFTLRRMFAKEGNNDQTYDFFYFNDNGPPDYIQMLYQFGLFASKVLNEGRFSFSKDDLLQSCDDSLSVLRLGILTEIELKSGHKRKTWYEPLHLTFLEFAFAYSFWIALMHKPDCLELFSLRWIVNYFYFNQKSMVLPFLFGLCGKELGRVCSALRHDKSRWLRTFTAFCDECELIAESQLKVSELAKVFLSLIPSDYVVLDKLSGVGNILLKETLIEALRVSQISRIIFNEKVYYITSEQCYKLPRKIQLQSEYSAEPFSEAMRDLPTHQNLHISTSETKNCTFLLTIRDALITEQLRWLSKWLVIERLYLNKPIHEITYLCSKSLLAETLSQIAQLISKEKVVSVSLESSNLCSDQFFKEFVRIARQSKELLDINIAAENVVFVDLGGKEGKRWRKVELNGRVIPQIGCKLGSFHEFNTLDEDSFIKGLPATIDILNVSVDVPGCIPLRLLVQRDSSKTSQNLSEMHVTFRNNAKSLLKLCNIGYLHNLKVLAIELPTDNKLNEQDIISSILLVITHCRFFVRLELWEGCTEEFITTFFEALITENIRASSKRYQSDNKNFLLDTLMLSPFISSKNEAAESTTVSLAKKLLQTGILRQLWLASLRDVDGYAKLEFIKLFSPTEGFIYEMEEESTLQFEGIIWNRSSFHFETSHFNAVYSSMCLFKLSMEKQKQIMRSEV